MSKYVKKIVVDELTKKFTGVNEFLVVDMTGIDGIANNQLRGKLRNKGIKLMMVKNAMMRRAMTAAGMAAAAGLFTTGSCTVVYGGDSIVDLAKEIKAASVGKTVIKFKGAYVDGSALDAAAATQLVNMKSRKEMLGEIVMLTCSPARRLAGALVSPGSIIAGCLKAIAEKTEKAAA
jgi:large subunit ribosomal protein L10